MLDIFLVQFAAAALGAASTGLADWLYHSSRIRQGLHSFWVAASIAVICLPIFVWTSAVFLGIGTPSQLVAGSLVSIIFFWVHQKLRKVPPLQKCRAQSAPVAPLERDSPPRVKAQQLNPRYRQLAGTRRIAKIKI
jgi:hypothetical protein